MRMELYPPLLLKKRPLTRRSIWTTRIGIHVSSSTRSSSPGHFWHVLLRWERPLEGINAAKIRGIYKGRKSTIKPDELRRLRKEGLGATAIAKRRGVGRASVYRVLTR